MQNAKKDMQEGAAKLWQKLSVFNQFSKYFTVVKRTFNLLTYFFNFPFRLNITTYVTIKNCEKLESLWKTIMMFNDEHKELIKIYLLKGYRPMKLVTRVSREKNRKGMA